MNIIICAYLCYFGMTDISCVCVIMCAFKDSMSKRFFNVFLKQKALFNNLFILTSVAAAMTVSVCLVHCSLSTDGTLNSEQRPLEQDYFA